MSDPFIPLVFADLDWLNGAPYSIKYKSAYFYDGGIHYPQAVFIDGNNLIRRWQSLPATHSFFTIAETGFGTGLNFLFTWYLWEQYAPEGAQLHFISCEKHPFTKSDLIKSLNMWPIFNKQAKQLIDKYPVLTPGNHQLLFANGTMKLTLMLGDAFECFEQLLVCGDAQQESSLRASFIDAWYLDGFSPQKNKSMWTPQLIRAIGMLSHSNTTLAATTADIRVKSLLSETGFIVSNPADSSLSHQITLASFKETQPFRFRTRSTPWSIGKPHQLKNKSALIIGAGLAGCYCAFALAKRGWRVQLIDELDGPGKGGSANKQSVIFPKLSAYKSPLTQLMLSAFLHSHQLYKELIGPEMGELYGSLLLAYNEKEIKAQHSLSQWLEIYPELGQLVDCTKASELAGIELNKTGLYIPLSGWIDAPALCHRLIESKLIELITRCSVHCLNYKDDEWEIQGMKAPVLILANGAKISSFNETRHLPIKSIRGQMTAIASTPASKKLKIPLSAEGHILPRKKDRHWLGATYELGFLSPHASDRNDLVNLAKLSAIDSNVFDSPLVSDHWSGIRASTPDYLPVVGPMPIAHEFYQCYAGLASNSRRWIDKPGPYYQGLYGCAGFGSRGLTTIPFAGDFLASMINNEFNSTPRNLVQALSPARFLRKDIIRDIKR